MMVQFYLSVPFGVYTAKVSTMLIISFILCYYILFSIIIIKEEILKSTFFPFSSSQSLHRGNISPARALLQPLIKWSLLL